MAATAAQIQTAIAFARVNRISPSDMLLIIDQAIASQFIDGAGGSQMITLNVGADGVNITLAYDSLLKLIDVYQRRVSGGVVSQSVEWIPETRYPGTFQ